MTSRRLVVDALELRAPERTPRQLWTLPWAERTWPAELAAIRGRFPDDLVMSPGFLREPLRTAGEEYETGTFVDEWGCRFESRQAGIIGEVKEPFLRTWDDLGRLRPPRERLSVDAGAVDDFCARSDAFVYARTIVRPFELLQFLRGPENLYVDLAERPAALGRLIERVQEFYLEELALWAGTDVDALFCADDWGSQNALLVSPALWRELFKPLYRAYAEIAHRHGKYLFMHSDGHIAAILPDLVEIGVDALNAQVFCMDIEDLGRRFAGRIAFWGEVDRQHLLARGTPAEVGAAVGRLRRAFDRRGGVIAQCEFGVGARPENVAAVFEAWSEGDGDPARGRPSPPGEGGPGIGTGTLERAGPAAHNRKVIEKRAGRPGRYRMDRKPARTIVILVAAAILTVPSFAKDAVKVVDSAWTAAPANVDGLEQDWEGVPFLTDPGSKAQYALRNDGRNLYIAFVFKTPEAASTVEATGLKVFFGPEGKKSKDRGVHFLKKPLTADGLIESLEKKGETLTEARKAEIRQKKDYTVFEADVINAKKVPAPADPAVPTEPPAFAARSRAGQIVYEFRVPLSRTNQPGGVGAEPGRTLKVGFDWGGLTNEMKRAMMSGDSGGPGAAPSLDGSLAKERNDQARGGGARLTHNPRTRQHAFWIDVKLAAGPAN